MRNTSQATSPYKEYKTWIPILVSHLLFLAVALWSDLQLIYLLWAYWVQSIIINLYTFRRIINAPKQADFDEGAIIEFFFVNIVFHIVHLFFLSTLTTDTDVDTLEFLYLTFFTVSFWWNHRKGYQEHLEGDTQHQPDFEKIMQSSNQRIFPMHLGLIGASFVGHDALSNSTVLCFFILLKIAADLDAHKKEFARVSPKN
jgi:hypothetical protein